MIIPTSFRPQSKSGFRYGQVFCSGAKELTLKISFNDVEDRRCSPTTSQTGEKRGTPSVTKTMLREREAQLDAEESSSGQKPIWRNVYNLMR